MSELAKAYEPQAVEAHLYQQWLDANVFHADPSSPKPGYSIVIPPPNVTGVLTMGHVLNNSIQDVLARRARMQGFEVLWLPGTDHAGIATQNVVEKKIRKEEKKTRHDYGREEFTKLVWQWKEKHGGIIINQLKKLGCSCDWERERFTMDEDYSQAVLEVFVKLYERGHIYRGKRMVNWCPGSLTAISDEEVIPKPQKGTMCHFRYESVDESGFFLEIATTRPETIMGDTAIAVHPSDERYRKWIGRKFWRPFPKEPVIVIADEHIDPKFGTGVLKVTPAHDKADFEIGQRHNLEIIDILTPDGKINCPLVPELHGLDRFEARKRAVELLKEKELLVKEEPYQNNVGFSERADVPIEPRLSLQWFVKYPKIDEALAVVRGSANSSSNSPLESDSEPILRSTVTSTAVPPTHSVPASTDHPASIHDLVEHARHSTPTDSPTAGRHGVAASPSGSEARIHFHPERWEKVYAHWLDNIQDWCISRQLWWGHRIPVWYKGAEMKCQIVAPGPDWEQDPDVLDTWFSSWLWAYATMDGATRKKFYPTSALVTGPDIIFLWVARMIIAGLEFEPGQSDRIEDNIPFRDVYFTGLIRDSQGRKMSKSLGNSPDPLDLIAKYGADGLRFGLLRIAPQGQDIRFDEKQIEEGRNFCNKLWNACRFRVMQGEIDPLADPSRHELSVFAQHILAGLDSTIATINAAYAKYEFSIAAAALYDYVWNQFCSKFLEAAKADFRNEQSPTRAGTLAAIDYVLAHILRALHPVLPFITEELWLGLGFGRSTIQFEKWPESVSFKADPAKVAQATAIYQAVDAGRRLRSEFQLQPNQQVAFLLLSKAELTFDEQVALKVLLNASTIDLIQTAPPKVPSLTTLLGDLFLPVEGLIDVEKEKLRLAKEIEKARTDLERESKKLSNEQMLAKAPVEKVNEWRRVHQEAKDRLAKLQEQLSHLG